MSFLYHSRHMISLKKEKKSSILTFLTYQSGEQTEPFWVWVFLFREGGQWVRISDLKVCGRLIFQWFLVMPPAGSYPKYLCFQIVKALKIIIYLFNTPCTNDLICFYGFLCHPCDDDTHVYISSLDVWSEFQTCGCASDISSHTCNRHLTLETCY